jgi:hypothetical protein
MTDADRVRKDLESTHDDLRRDAQALVEHIHPARAAKRQAHRMSDRITTLRERVLGAAAGSTDRVAEAGHTAAGVAGDAGAEVRAQADGHPLTAGLVAFGIGWALAGLLPPSDREHALGRRAADLATDLAGDQLGPAREQAGKVGKAAARDLAGPALHAAGAVKDAAVGGTSSRESG